MRVDRCVFQHYDFAVDHGEKLYLTCVPNLQFDVSRDSRGEDMIDLVT